MYGYAYYFIIFAFIGWCVEVVFHAFTKKEFVNKGFLNGPLCPIYGFWAVIVSLVLTPLKDTFIPLFVGAVVLTSTLAFVTGFLLEKIFHHKWWDYSDIKFNLYGYICLPLSIIWGFICVFLIKTIFPLTDVLISSIPTFSGVIMQFIIGLFLMVDLLITILTLARIKSQERVMKEITTSIKNNIESINEIVSSNRFRIKEKFAELSIENGIFKRRLLKAVPGLKPENYNEQLGELKEILHMIQLETKELTERQKSRNERHNKKIIQFYEHSITKENDRSFAFGFGFTKLFWLFMIGNILGSFLETIWCIALYGKFEMRTSLVIGFFIPIYGIGAVLMAVCLCKLYKKRDMLIFIVGGAIGAAIEFSSSIFQEVVFGTRSWDYSNTIFNLNGRTNLMFALIWGILGVIWVKDIYPFLAEWIEKIPKKIGAILTITLVLFIICDMALSTAALYRKTERKNGKPTSNAFETYLDEKFSDNYLDWVYPHMKYVVK